MSNDIPDTYWKNLLAITTRAQADDPTSTFEKSEPKILDEESRTWLETVMKDLVRETDPFRQLQSVIQSLHQYASSIDKVNEEDEEQILDLADRLDDLLSIADLSNQFINNGGILILEAFIIKSESDILRSKFAQIILTWAENNEVAQDAIVQSGFFDKLINVLAVQSTSNSVLSSVLSAVSGTVRSNKNAFIHFKNAGGPDALLNIVKNAATPQLAAKSARILASISYTMQEYDNLAKLLNSSILDSYQILIQKLDHFSELEYIREYILNYVEWHELEESQRNSFLAALDQESRRDLDETNVEMIGRLLKKFAPLRTG